ncbi:tumor susceptibility gene 101 protein [Parambassis ranga]|uniref:Tumor susceptibility gene 101 protein n=1 Tax=Parambassis ranga TaxID=210632 RepID=A0A6P7IHQ3_9TELE|nr:tumor susceptibility gene 101 protein-like [Parambassis ranga]
MTYSVDTIRKMLPKAYLRKHVAHEIHTALTYFKDLVPMMDKYVYSDGTIKNMMSLSGTIPVKIKDAIYKTPICLWIEENYPLTAPICYVRPTHEMMVLRGKYVSTNGEVLLPYLEEWRNAECDLVSLLQVMTVVFEEIPPLCMKPAAEPEQASCWLQFQKQSGADGSSYLSLVKDGQPILQGNETNC